jgi:hypothetical protein
VIKGILSSEDYQLKPHYHKQLDRAWYLIPPRIKTKKLKSPYYHFGTFTFSVDEHKDEKYLFIGNHVEKGSLSSRPTGENWF